MDSKTDIQQNNESELLNEAEAQEGWSAEEEIIPDENELEFENETSNQE
jgi:hypothetical protein